MKIYTIGFAGKTAEQFFELLRAAGVTRLLDIRLNNVSQLAAFTKKNDLEYFLKRIIGADYHHILMLAPTKEILEKYRGDKDWATFESSFKRLLESRRLDEKLDRSLFDRDVVLLCSEETAEKCHRRLVAEYLEEMLPADGVVHL